MCSAVHWHWCCWWLKSWSWCYLLYTGTTYNWDVLHKTTCSKISLSQTIGIYDAGALTYYFTSTRLTIFPNSTWITLKIIVYVMFCFIYIYFINNILSLLNLFLSSYLKLPDCCAYIDTINKQLNNNTNINLLSIFYCTINQIHFL